MEKNIGKIKKIPVFYKLEIEQFHSTGEGLEQLAEQGPLLLVCRHQAQAPDQGGEEEESEIQHSPGTVGAMRQVGLRTILTIVIFLSCRKQYLNSSKNIQ